jgi:predicted DNA-binding transcriptional regulator AlpA
MNMSTAHTSEYKIDFDAVLGRAKSDPSADSEFLDFRGLAAKLGASEQWVRRNVRRTYTRDPIPHLRFGRMIRFVWDSQEMQEWIERRKEMAQGTKSHSTSPDPASYNVKRTEFGPKRKERMQ